MREAVAGQVIAFKQAESDAGRLHCAVTGAELTWDDAEVDHMPPGFGAIADAFATAAGGYDKISLVHSADGMIGRPMEPAFETVWVWYHHQQARLRILSRAAHRKLTRETAEAESRRHMTTVTGVFAASCEAYAQAGWPCVIPVPPEAKFPPPEGFTGAAGRDTTPEDLAAWAQTRGNDSVALRMPDGVIGIDVDEYVKGEVTKQGAATMTARTAKWGPLPATWSSTARGQGQPSRILVLPGPARAVRGPGRTRRRGHPASSPVRGSRAVAALRDRHALPVVRPGRHRGGPGAGPG